VKDVREWEISFADTKFISVDEHKILSKRCSPRVGDILLTKIGTVGQAAVVPAGAPVFDIFVSVALLRPSKEKIREEFLCAVLNTNICRAQFNRIVKGVGVPDLHLEDIEETLFPLPPLQRQTELAAELQAARAARNDKLRSADALLASFDAYLLDTLDLSPLPPDTRDVFAVRLGNVRGDHHLNADYFHPERILAIKTLQTTISARLADVVDFKRDQCLASASENYIGLAHVQSHTGELVAADEEVSGQCFAFQPDDVLFGRLRPYLNKVHRAERAGVCSTEFHVMRIRARSRVLPDYLATMLRSSLIVAQTRHMMTGNTHPRLTNDDVVNLVVPVPPPDVQQQIADEVRRRRDEARRLRTDAEAHWTAAKERFERQLLSSDDL
jgi:type I restriction enzyme, S subunit